MLSENAKQWIKDNAEGIYTGNIDSAISLFDHILELPADNREFSGIHNELPNYIEDMAVAVRRKELDPLVFHYSRIEAFIHYVLYLVDPVKEASRKWTLSPLLVEGFGIVPSNFNIDSGSPASVSFRYKAQYMQAYNLRNKDAHYFQSLKQEELFSCLKDITVVYLDVSMRNSSKISDIYRQTRLKSSIDIDRYVRSVKSEHRKRTDAGFGFVDLIWSLDGKDLRYRDVMRFTDPVQLLGEAGCGKTTLMQEIIYDMACNFKNSKATPLPVFVPLKELEGTSFTINSLISARLGIDIERFRDLVKGYSLALFFDGFNEILNSETKSRFALLLESYVKKNPTNRYYLSDRSVVRSNIVILDDAKKIRLVPLSSGRKSELIKKNTGDPKAAKLLLDKLNSDPGYFSSINTPLQIKHLIDVVERNGIIPMDIIGEYLNSLIEREKIEKKDVNAHYLKDFLDALAIAIDNSPYSTMSEVEVKLLFRSIKEKLGYTSCDTDEVLRLAIDMGILSKEREEVMFLMDDYLAFFWEEGGNRKMELLI